jgi:membrane-associated phospholipid phosphatase
MHESWFRQYKSSLLRLALLFIFFVCCVVGFGLIADEVHEGDTLPYDQFVLQSINATSTPFWDVFYTTVTQLGGIVGVVIIAAVLSVLLLVKKKYKKFIIVVASVGGAALLNVILKLLFERVRPDLWEQLVVETSYSFPSGHAMASSALALAIIAICWRTRWRWAALIGGATFILMIGYSRLYLSVHYPTDIIAGWLVSTIWVLLVVGVLYGNRVTRLFQKKTTTYS